MADLLSLEEARSRILEDVEPLGTELVPVAEAAGRILAEPARALVDLPPFRSSAMDGYALRVADTPGKLPVVFHIAAGRPSPSAVQPGEAMEISTGGVVAQGADSVVPVEKVVKLDNSVEIPEAAEPGANIREVGRDVRAGDPVAAPGTRLGPAQVGALAAAGLEQVRCARAPRSAVLATGTELRPPGAPLAPGEIYDSNGVMLAAQLSSAGAEAERLPVAGDDESEHRAALEHGLGFDVLVTSGGVSVGPHDLVRKIARELGVEEVFWGVAVQPGKPLSFGVRDKTLVFGLPGNPVSTLVAFELFVRPALQALQGASDPGPHFEVGTLAAEVRRKDRDQLLRAHSKVSTTGVELQTVSGQESHMIVRAASADSLVLVPRGKGVVRRGESVRFLRLV